MLGILIVILLFLIKLLRILIGGNCQLHQSSPVNRGTPSVTMTTDASFVGWGAEFNGQSTGGNWSLSE